MVSKRARTSLSCICIAGIHIVTLFVYPQRHRKSIKCFTDDVGELLINNMLIHVTD